MSRSRLSRCCRGRNCGVCGVPARLERNEKRNAEMLQDALTTEGYTAAQAWEDEEIRRAMICADQDGPCTCPPHPRPA